MRGRARRGRVRGDEEGAGVGRGHPPASLALAAPPREGYLPQQPAFSRFWPLRVWYTPGLVFRRGLRSRSLKCGVPRVRTVGKGGVVPQFSCGNASAGLVRRCSAPRWGSGCSRGGRSVRRRLRRGFRLCVGSGPSRSSGGFRGSTRAIGAASGAVRAWAYAHHHLRDGGSSWLSRSRTSCSRSSLPLWS